MKKVLLTAVAASIFGLSFARELPKNIQIAAVDTIQIMQKSKEGTLLTEKLQKEVEAHQEKAKQANKELMDAQEKITKDSSLGLESKEKLREKSEELMRKKKNLERELGDQEEMLRYKIQNEQITLRNKQITVVNKMADENDWKFVVDKNTPGLIFASKSVDISDLALEKVDEAFAAEMEKSMITGGKNAEAKLAKNDAGSLNTAKKKKA